MSVGCSSAMMALWVDLLFDVFGSKFGDRLSDFANDLTSFLGRSNWIKKLRGHQMKYECSKLQ